MRKTLTLEDADVIAIDRFGNVVATLPEGLTAQDIDVAARAGGADDVGAQGQHRLRGGAGDAVPAGAHAAARAAGMSRSRARSPSC